MAWNLKLPYFIHRYNTTWLNERCIEIPLARAFLANQQGHGLELGNVLSHYGLGRDREVVDKYEHSPGVLNVDVVDYEPSSPLDFIVAISTLEHVGWDERPREPDKVLHAVDHLLSLLAPNGRLFVTAPLGYNPELDAAVIGRHWEPARQARFVKGVEGTWHQDDVLKVKPWGPSDTWPPAIWVAELVAG